MTGGDDGRPTPLPLDPAVDQALRRALGEIQRRGAIGGGPIDDAIEHARHFVAAIPAAVAPGATLVDLGSGGGLPGLVIAADRPDLRITLVERRAKRVDLLAYGVRLLDADARVEVIGGDVATVVAARPRSFDVVTARSFAPPPVLGPIARDLLVSSGVLLVSEPPGDDDRWPVDLLTTCQLVDDGRIGAVRRLRRVPTTG
ncbi:MAG: RsmG family class I SAM-dependent methyltransferase [Acidimicrobiales bacterium]